MNEVVVYKFKDFLEAFRKHGGKAVPDNSIPTHTRFTLPGHIAKRVCYGYLNKCFFVTTEGGLLIKYDLQGNEL